ncbi:MULTISPECIES: maleylacetoacetate isomerase [unclassified Ruegeria]|uniref:maleylacetoacetate isomerase n=1 Tax=unclassified Ruegeria TaxID=2625375 RepID=UPI001491C97B|nr:maleylacetoacetate isomerase [Ruegeria sp. HKCCD5849]NOD53768.1 maleylacetoacetate isomerase [Ruegeria sp. HKCCD5851]NOD69783.1 maleylacetoacetate isomerase [Ruegeria sp. HKCCD7303]
MSEVVLFDYWRSSASYRVRIALNLAGIDYDSVVVDLVGGEHKSTEHLLRNPQGFVPVLEIDGLRLTQSLAILEYLDQTRGLGLLPSDPVQKAKAQALAYAIAVDIHPVCNLSVARHATSLSTDADDMPGDWMRHFIRPGLQAFETMLGKFEQAPYCVGSQPGLADLCLIPQLYNARRWQVDLSDMPRVLEVETACASHPAFVAAHPDAHAPQ